MILISSFVVFSCKKVERPNSPEPTETAIVAPETAMPNEPMETIKTNPNGKFASMDFTNRAHDFGKIKADAKVETVFEFVNNGTVDLVIKNAVGSCGCTVPDYPKDPIKVGQKGSIKVAFDASKKTGAQSKSVTITANTPNGMEVIEIKADVASKN